MNDPELAALIARGRAAAESKMVDRCEVRLPPELSAMDAGGISTLEPGTLIYGPAIPPHFGRVKIQNTDAVYERDLEAGGHQFIQQRYRLDFPVSAPRVVENHRVTITQSPFDPHNVGRQFRVAGPAGKTMATAQRVNADELVGEAMV